MQKKIKNPITALRNAGMQTKLILICIIIIVPVFLASVYLMINVRGILQNYAISEVKTDTDNVSTRFYDLLTVAENVAAGFDGNADIARYIETGDGDNPFAAFPVTLPQIESIRVYSVLDNDVTGDFFAPADESVRQTDWFERVSEGKKPFWDVVEHSSASASAGGENADVEYDLALIQPIIGGRMLAAAVITVNPVSFQNAAGSLGYPVIFTMENGLVIYSGTALQDVLDVMPLPSSDDNSASVISDNFFYGDDFTLSVPFTMPYTENEFRIYMTLPYSELTKESRNITLLYFWYVGLCLILSILISFLLTGFFAKRIRFLKNQMLKVTYGDFELTDDFKGSDEINELYGLLKQMVKSIMKSNTETNKARLQAETFRLNTVEAEFKALASQINPHFLYNTLETIRMKAYSNDDKETADLLKVLGKFMRRSLAVKDGLVNLTSELEFTHNYLKLQSARFGDRVTYNIYAEPDGEYKILPLIIQPLVENAYAHGVESVKSGGYIFIAVKNAGQNVIIDVTDNGMGMDEDTLYALREKINIGDTSSGRSIGLTNVHMRIKKYFGESYGMQIFSEEGKGTMIRLTLPK